MPKHNQIETIVRGVWLHKRKVLFCQSVKHGYLYLPGGHIEPTETAATALAREMHEELGVSLTVGPFIGASEACFSQPSWKTGKLKQHHEINLLFELSHDKQAVPDPAAITSQEPHIRFVWLSAATLTSGSAGKILPASVAQAVVFHVERRKDVPKGYPAWATDWS
jgi:8-oxo-dGTP diphosphatase